MTITLEHIRINNARTQNFVDSYDLRCNWEVLREQLLHQWALLTETDLDMAGPDSQRIAMLIERKYGIASRMIINYLANFVRTMPLQ